MSGFKKRAVAYTEKDLRNAYKTKARSCENRMIAMEFTEDEYVALLRARTTFTCAFTNIPFVMNKGSDHMHYPTIDRIDPLKGYSKDNCILITRYIHELKTTHIELQKPTKGIGELNIGNLHRVQKILKSKANVFTMMKPYLDMYDRVNNSLDTEHKQKIAEMAKQAEELQTKKESERKEIARKKVFSDQRDMTSHYNTMFTTIEKDGGSFEIHTKEFRDMMRVTKCKISGEVFENVFKKKLFVIDKSKPVTKSNVLVVTKKVQESLDYLSGGDIMVLKKATSNLVKNLL